MGALDQDGKPGRDSKEALSPQDRELDSIRERLELLEQNTALQDMLESIYLELGRNLNEISDLRDNQVNHAKSLHNFHSALFDLRDKVTKKNVALQEELEMTRLENETAKNQLKRYREERDRLEALVKFRDYENDQLRRDVDQVRQEGDLLRRDLGELKVLIRQLGYNFEALLSSRRWKTGNALVDLFYTLTFRKKEHSHAEQMKILICELEQWQPTEKYEESAGQGMARTVEAGRVEAGRIINEENACGENLNDNPAAGSGLNELNALFQDICDGLENLLQGKRWRLGRSLGAVIFFPFNRGKTPPEMAVLNPLLARNRQQLSSGELYNRQDLDLILAELEEAYRSLLASRRFKIGSAIVAVFNTLLFRKNHNPATEKIESGLQHYHARRRQERTREETAKR